MFIFFRKILPRWLLVSPWTLSPLSEFLAKFELFFLLCSKTILLKLTQPQKGSVLGILLGVNNDHPVPLAKWAIKYSINSL